MAAPVSAVAQAAEPVPAPEAWLTAHGVGQWAGPGALPLWIAARDWYGMNARSSARARAAGLAPRPLVDTLADALGAREADPPADPTPGLADAVERDLLAALVAA